MKKLWIGISILLLMTGCGKEEKTLSCSSTNETNGVRTNNKYEIKYIDDEVKQIKITYDYNQEKITEKDGIDVDTNGLDTNDNTNQNDGTLESDEVIDGVIGDALDTTINGITKTILDLAGIKNTYENQINNYDNIEGFSYKVDIDNDNEYKIIYTIDMEKIKDEDMSKFNITKDFSEMKTTYQDLGYTCE